MQKPSTRARLIAKPFTKKFVTIHSLNPFQQEERERKKTRLSHRPAIRVQASGFDVYIFRIIASSHTRPWCVRAGKTR